MRPVCAVCAEPLVEADEPAFELAAKDGLGPEAAQEVRVQRRIQAVETEVRRGIETLEPRRDGAREPRRRVHRQVDGDQARLAHRPLVEVLDREIDAADRCPRLTEPGRGRRQPERLMAEIKSGNKDDLHCRLPRPAVMARSSGIA